MDRVAERHEDWWCVFRHIQKRGEFTFAAEEGAPADPLYCLELLPRSGFGIGLEIAQTTPAGHVR